MLPYQVRYLENAREILSLRHPDGPEADFEAWLERREARLSRLRALRRENIALLNDHLFPQLDDIHRADDDALAALSAFADALLDWKTNLDCGVYVVIHDALLSLCRLRRDRNGLIRELYKLGMGLYYQRRMVAGMGSELSGPFAFQNEMVFTEAAAFLRYYERIDDEPTRGYILRALANIALCAQTPKRRIAASARMLNILRDESYRAMAPSLPWDAFLRGTHQQMSANRSELSQGDLTREELALVLDSCYEVFKPEEASSNPSVRWLWPYYEMEYNCGYVDLRQTLDRMERLIEGTAYDQYDMSGLYGNVQLAIYYGRLMAANPAQQAEPHRVRFLGLAYEKMLRTMLTCPPERFDDYFYYNLDLVVTDYFEMEGLFTYREVVERLMCRFDGGLYLKGRLAGALLRRLCEALLDADPAYFDDLPPLNGVGVARRRAALLEYADACGLYFDFGLFKMNIGRLSDERSLFDMEDRILQLHPQSGHDDLVRRRSTAHFADIALGHHRFYGGAGGYPESYERTASAYRQMTDVAAVVAFLLEREGAPFEETLEAVLSNRRQRFSPMVTACLGDAEVAEALKALLQAGPGAFARALYEAQRAAL